MPNRLIRQYIVVEVSEEEKASSIVYNDGKPFERRSDAIALAKAKAKEYPEAKFFIAELKEYYIGKKPEVEAKVTRQYNRAEDDDDAVIIKRPTQPKIYGS